MRKHFLISLFVLMTGTAVMADNVATLSELKTALSKGGEITLTANIETGEQLNVSQPGTIINGGGYAIKGTQQYVMQVSANATIKNLVIYAAKSAAGRGLLVNNGTNNIVLSLDNVTINATERGMDVWYSDNVTLNIKDSKIQLVPNGGAAQDATTGMPATDNYDIVTTSVNGNYSRGLNTGSLTNSKINLVNTTIQGFFYNVNVLGYTFAGTKFTAENCTFKGRAALNCWGNGGEYEFTDCAVIGINNFGSKAESFACFVFNQHAECHDNILTINGGTVVAAVFNETGASNPNATQFMVTQRGTNNEIVINNASYTCTKDLGNEKGGIIEYLYPDGGNTVEINGGTYDCPEIYSLNYTTDNTVTINGGSFNVNVISTEVDSYPQIVCISTEINGGTFTIADENQSLDKLSVEIEVTDEGGQSTTQTFSVVSNTTETIENQDGTTSVVPAGTKDNTSSATKTEIAWNNASDWTVPTAASNVVIAANQKVTLEGTGAAYRIDMGAGAKLLVKAGATLTIGKGGVALNNNETAKPLIEVEAGGHLIMNGLMYGSLVENLIVHTSEANPATLLIAPDVQAFGENHPNATYVFASKAKQLGGGDCDWQRFGLPTFDGVAEMKWDNNVQTAVYEFDYQINDWNQIAVNKGAYAFNGKPFQCYDMTIDGTSEIEYTFAGALMGNTNAPLPFVKGWNYYANSYTAPIDIRSFIGNIRAQYGNVSATVYVYRRADNWWDPVNLAALRRNTAPQTQIYPMQAFIMELAEGNNTTAVIDFTENVYKPFTNTKAEAPARYNGDDFNAVDITVSKDGKKDLLTLWEEDAMSEAFDNGYDATKFVEKPAFLLYRELDGKKLGTYATNDLTDKKLVFETSVAGEFTMNFSNVAGNTINLYDVVEKKLVKMEEGASYTFTAEAKTDAERFIVNPSDIATGLENNEMDTVTSKFVGKDGRIYIRRGTNVYTLQGQLTK